MPAINLRRVQIGQQTTFGTPVAATAIIRGVTDASFDVVNQTEVVQEIGLVTGSSIVPGSARMAEGSITFVPSYQDIRYVLQGVFGAPTTTGAADPYTHTWTAPALQALPSPQIYTIEYGVAGMAYRVNTAIINEFTLTSAAGENVECEVNFAARSIDTLASLATLTPRAVDPLSHTHARLWINTNASAYGATEITGALIRAEWNVNTGRHMKLFGGSRYPQDWGDGRWESTLTLELEYTGQAKALVDALLGSEVLRRIRVQWEADTNRRLTVDLFGTLTENPTLFGDRDGNMTVELTFAATVDLNITPSRWCSITLLNNEQTLP
ncbi:MAG: phage tail tube protein [Anaerolineae bacterium]|nr:phage tail tube protein [Anaerolineae bacterium]